LKKADQRKHYKWALKTLTETI